MGRRVPQLVELVDVMPTLAEIAGLPSRTTNLTLLDGTSLLPLLKDDVASWKNKSAFSQYPRKSNNDSALWRHNGIDHVNRYAMPFLFAPSVVVTNTVLTRLCVL